MIATKQGSVSDVLDVLFLNEKSMNSVYAVAAIAGIVAVIAIYNKLNVTIEEQREKLEKAKESYNEIEASIKDLNKELVDIQARIKELEAMGVLTLSDQEELDRLSTEREELERIIHLKTLELEVERDKRNRTFIKTMDKDIHQGGEFYDLLDEEAYVNVQFHNLEALKTKLSEASTEKERQRIQEQIDDIKDYFLKKSKEWDSDTLGIDYIQDPKTDDDKNVNAWLDYVNDFKDRMAIALNSDNARTDAFNRILNKSQFKDIKEQLTELGNSGELTAEKVNELIPAGSELYNELSKLGILDITNWAEGVANSFGKMETSAGKAAENITEFTDNLKNLTDISESLSSLSSAWGDVYDNGHVSIDTISKINKEFENVKGVEDYIKTIASARSNSAKFQRALSELTYAQLEAKYGVTALANADANMIAITLKDNGIKNANVIATNAISRAQAKAAFETMSFANANEDSAAILGKELSALGASATAVKSFEASYKSAQDAMTASVATGAKNRLNVVNTELMTIKTVTQAYEYIATLGKFSSATATEKAKHVNSLIGSGGEKGKQAESIVAFGKAQEDLQQIINNIGSFDVTDYSDTKKDEIKKAKDNFEKDADQITQIQDDIANKEIDFAEKMTDAWKEENLESLKSSLEATKAILERYSKELDIIDFSVDLYENDNVGKIDLLVQKLELLKEQGQALRTEFDSVASTIPRTGDEAQEIAGRIEELGDSLRENVTTLRETTSEIELLRVSAIKATADNYLKQYEDELSRLDTYINALKSNDKDSGKYLNQIISVDLLLPTMSDFDKTISDKRKHDKKLVREEQTTQDKINKIVSDALAQQARDNSKTRERERKKLIRDMEKTRKETAVKLKQARNDYADSLKEFIKTTENSTNVIGNLAVGMANSIADSFMNAGNAVDTLSNKLDAAAKKASESTSEINQTIQDSILQNDQLDITDPNVLKKIGDGTYSTKGNDIVSEAKKYLGTKYAYGGDNPTEGFDCSGFVKYVLGESGTGVADLKRVSAEQADDERGKKISNINDLAPGDLVFFEKSGRVHHVGIYIGDGKMIHAPHTGDVVKTSSITSGTYKEEFYCGRRMYEKGTSNHPGGIAIVGDNSKGNGVKPELAVYPNGNMEIVGQQGVELRDLPKGTAVYSNEDTKKILNGTNIPKYENGKHLGVFTATAYCNCEKCCGKYADGKTASGTIPKQGRTIAVDPSVIPLGSKVTINGHTYIAEDTGGAIKGNKVDIFFDSHNDALNWGRQNVDVYSGGAVSEPTPTPVPSEPSSSDSKVGSNNKYGIPIKDILAVTGEGTSPSNKPDYLTESSMKDSIEAISDYSTVAETKPQTSTDVMLEHINNGDFAEYLNGFTLGVSDNNRRFNQQYYSDLGNIQNNASLTDSQRAAALNELKRRQVDGYSELGINGLGQSYVEMYKTLSENFLQWNNEAREDPTLFNQEVFDEWLNVLSEVQDKIAGVESTLAEVNQFYLDDLESRLQVSENWISKRNLYSDWEQFSDNEIEAWERVKKWVTQEYYQTGLITHEEYMNKMYDLDQKGIEARNQMLNNAVDGIEKYGTKLTEEYEDKSENIDKLISKEESLLTIKQKQFDIENKIYDAQHSANKSISDSRISKQYLDSDEYAKIFNEEDYQKISKIIFEINDDVGELTTDYTKRINSLGKDELYLQESITAEYERQLAAKEHQLEIANAEIELTKKQQQLDNVLNGKNVRFLNSDGNWEWIADTDKVRQATDELLDAEYKISDIKRKTTQQDEIDSANVRISNLNNQKAAVNDQINMINEQTGKLRTAIENLISPVSSLGTLTNSLASIGVANINSAVNGVLDAFSRLTNQSYSHLPTRFNSNIVNVGSDGSAPKGLPIGTVVKTSGGNYLITGVHENGTYNSTKLVNYANISARGYASGTPYATPGIKPVDENGEETYISSAGILHNFIGGEKVFNEQQTEALWELSKNNAFKGLDTIAQIPNSGLIGSGNIDSSQNLYGDVVIQNVANFDDFVTQLTNTFKKK